MKPLFIPERYNYIAVFLTLACNLRCSYCINRFGGDTRGGRAMSAEDWVRGLNRLVSRHGLPVTLQGGEPSLHKGFIEIINGLKKDLEIDVLTNLQFDEDELMARVDPERLKRDAPYASVRVSWHPETMELKPLLDKTLKLLSAGFSVGIWSVLHPSHLEEVERARDDCTKLGIDFRTKEFLGVHNGRMYGSYRYEGACSGEALKTVACRTTELIIGPDGSVHRCHSDLYGGRPPVGHILDGGFEIRDEFLPCRFYGACNPCDVKVKTDRFQRHGHTSVDILDTPCAR